MLHAQQWNAKTKYEEEEQRQVHEEKQPKKDCERKKQQKMRMQMEAELRGGIGSCSDDIDYGGECLEMRGPK